LRLRAASVEIFLILRAEPQKAARIPNATDQAKLCLRFRENGKICKMVF